MFISEEKKILTMFNIYVWLLYNTLMLYLWILWLYGVIRDKVFAKLSNKMYASIQPVDDYDFMPNRWTFSAFTTRNPINSFRIDSVLIENRHSFWPDWCTFTNYLTFCCYSLFSASTWKLYCIIYSSFVKALTKSITLR